MDENKTLSTVGINKAVNPLANTGDSGATVAWGFIAKNDIFLRRSKFDGLAEDIKTADIDGKKARLWDFDLLDYDVDQPVKKHCHYAVWLVTLDDDAAQTPYCYATGKQLTDLADHIMGAVDEEREAVINDIKTNGLHGKFEKITKKDGNPFVSFKLIP